MSEETWTKEIMLLDGDAIIYECRQLSQNRILLLWFQYDDMGYYTFSHQVYDLNFAKLGSTFQYSLDTFPYRIIAGENGEFLVFWREENKDTGYCHFYVQRFSNSGEPVDTPVCVNPNIDSWCGGNGIFVTPLPNSTLFCSWYQWRPGGRYGQILTMDGQRLGEEFMINPADIYWMISLNDQILLENGDLAFIAGNEIIYRWSLSERRIIEEIRLCEYGSDVKVLPFSFDKYIVRWQEYGSDGYSVWGQVCDRNLRPIGDKFKIGIAYGNGIELLPVDPFHFISVVLLGATDEFWFELQKYNSYGDKLEQPKLLDCQMHAFWQVQDLAKEYILFICPIYENGQFVRCYAQKVNSSTLVAERKFNIYTKPVRYSSEYVIALPDGAFIVVWPTNRSIWAKQFPAQPIQHLLSSFHLIAPTLDATLNTTMPTLSWECASQQEIAYSYEVVYSVMIDKSPEFKSPIKISVEGETSIHAPELESGHTYFWKVQAENIAGDTAWSDIKAFFISPTADVKDERHEALSDHLTLLSNYPNPFNAYTIVPFVLPQSATVNFQIYDINGRQVFSSSEYLPDGEHSKRIELSDLSSGLYFLTVSDGQVVEFRKLMLIK